MPVKDFKASQRIELNAPEITREANITSEWSDIITFTVPENRVVLPLDGKIMYIKIPNEEHFTGQDLSGSSLTLSLSNTIAKTDGGVVGQMAKCWGYHGGNGAYETIPISSIDDAADTVTVDTSTLSGSPGASQDVHLIYQTGEGTARIYAQKPSGGNIRKVSLHEFNMGKMHRRNVNKVGIAPTLSRTLPLIEDARLILSVKTAQGTLLGQATGVNDPGGTTLTLGSDPNEVATFSIGAAWGRMDQAGSQTRQQFNRVFTGVS